MIKIFSVFFQVNGSENLFVRIHKLDPPNNIFYLTFCNEFQAYAIDNTFYDSMSLFQGSFVDFPCPNSPQINKHILVGFLIFDLFSFLLFIFSYFLHFLQLFELSFWVVRTMFAAFFHL